MKKLFLVVLLFASIAGAQQISVATQSSGQILPGSAGTGLDTSPASRCPTITGGTRAFSGENCVTESSVVQFGAVADLAVGSGSISLSSPTTLVSAASMFSKSSVGKAIVVNGANSSGVLKTTIAAYLSPTSVALAASASKAVTNSPVFLGTDNSAAFNKALMVAGLAGGGVVFAPAGSYLVTETLLIPSNVHLRGATQSATVIVNPFATAQDAGMLTNLNFSTSNISYALNSDVTVSDITFDGENPTIGAPVNGVFYGLNFYGVTNLKIEDVTIRGTEGQGILANFCDRVTVRDNNLSSINLDGIQMQDTNNFIVNGNSVIASGDFGIEINNGHWFPRATTGTGHGMVLNNIVTGYSTVGIGLRGTNDSYNPNHTSLIDVTVSGNQVYSPRLRKAGGITLYESVSDSIITGNDVSGSGAGLVTAPSIYEGYTASSQRITISNNMVRNNLAGLVLTSLSNGIVQSNSVTGNTAQGIVGSLANTIFADNNIEGNNTATGNQVVSALQIVSGGSGYTSNFDVICTGGGETAGAVVTAYVSGGSVTRTQISFPGYGFSSSPSCTQADGTTGSGAKFNSQLASAAVVLDNAANVHLGNNRILRGSATYTYSVLETGYSQNSMLLYNCHDRPYSTQGHSPSIADYSNGTSCCTQRCSD